jgi:hypothetical protein
MRQSFTVGVLALALAVGCSTNNDGTGNPAGPSSGSATNTTPPNIVGQWEGTFLTNHSIALTFTSNSAGTAVHRTGDLFSRGPITVSALHPENIVFKMVLARDINPSITSDYIVTARFLNGFTEMKGTTVSGTQDFHVFRK